jgi:hypothetical protein
MADGKTESSTVEAVCSGSWWSGEPIVRVSIEVEAGEDNSLRFGRGLEVLRVELFLNAFRQLVLQVTVEEGRSGGLLSRGLPSVTPQLTQVSAQKPS